MLLPRITPDGRILATKRDTIDEYVKTGRHLGIFDSPSNATKYADQIHKDYASGKIKLKKKK